jgi:anaerobic magnesium-protoporphyrin IX monomethyl ester cyclase
MDKAKVKILCVIPKYDLTTKKFYHYLFPTGFAYIISMLKSHGYKSTTCLNLNHQEGAIADIMFEYLLKNPAKYLLIGGIVLDYPVLKLILAAIDKLQEKNIQKPIIILGGMFATSMPLEAMQDLSQVDYGVLGEAEETIVELMDALENNKDVSKITGLVYREKEELSAEAVERAWELEHHWRKSNG